MSAVALDKKKADESTKTMALMVESNIDAEADTSKIIELLMPSKTLTSIEEIILHSSSLKVAIEKLTALLEQSEQGENKQNKQNSLHIAFAILVFCVEWNHIDIARFVFEYKKLDYYINYSFIIHDDAYYNWEQPSNSHIPNIQPRRNYHVWKAYKNTLQFHYSGGFKDLSKVFNVSPHFRASIYPTTLLGKASFRGHIEW